MGAEDWPEGTRIPTWSQEAPAPTSDKMDDGDTSTPWGLPTLDTACPRQVHCLFLQGTDFSLPAQLQVPVWC